MGVKGNITTSATFKGRGYNRVRHFNVYVTQCACIRFLDLDLIKGRA